MFYASPFTNENLHSHFFLWTIYRELESSWICQPLPADLAMWGEMVCSNIPTTTTKNATRIFEKYNRSLAANQKRKNTQILTC